MAKKGLNQTSIDKSKSFLKGLTRDTDPSFIQDGMWTYARNAVNNTKEGDLGTLSNEESNALCAKIGLDITVENNPVIIGAIPLFEGKWIIYSAIYDAQNNNVITSEIGLFEEEFCKYRPIVRDTCLNFNKFNLVSGASREKEDCSWQVYWADGLNPDRYMNIGDPNKWPSESYSWLGGLDPNTINYYTDGTNNILWPGVAWEEDCVIVDDDGNTVIVVESENDRIPLGCRICKPLNKLSCDDIRLASLVKTPCIDVTVSSQQGTIENGSYAFYLAYTIDQQAVTNFFSPSYIQPIFNEINERGSLELNIDADTEHFDEFVLVVARFTNQNSSLKTIGYFSTNSQNIVIDQIAESLGNADEKAVLQQNPVFETSNQIAEGSRYLLRIGPTSKFDFNYQPLANLIKSKWVSVEYPEDYYIKGGKNAGYLRDEVYCFFIRWVYDTGDKSASYHIPGRPARDYSTPFSGTVNEADAYTDQNSLPGEQFLYETINTGTYTGNGGTPDAIDDFGGKIIAEGDMGFWQSTERYPDNRPDIWNSSYYCWTKSTDAQNDLCGRPIRHHRFPDNSVNQDAYHFDERNGQYFIRLMGVSFENIILPKDQDGKDIEGIVGYEILRSSRHGNKTIVAKGMVNNFRDYELQGRSNSDASIGLYANYPFNCIRPIDNSTNPNNENYGFNDPFILSRLPDNQTINPLDTEFVNQTLPQDLVSFHSPDTSFKNPYLSMSELKVYGHLQGIAEQRFIEPNGHPKFKLLADGVVLLGLVGGVLNAMAKTLPKRKQKTDLTANQVVQSVGPGPVSTPSLGIVGYTTADGVLTPLVNAANTTGTLGVTGTDPYQIAYNAAQTTLNAGGLGYVYSMSSYEKEPSVYELMPPGLAALGSIGPYIFYVLEGAGNTTDLIYALIRSDQYALEQISHGDYTDWVVAPADFPSRFTMADGIYVYDDVQDFPEFQDNGGTSIRYRINNKKRPKLTVLRTESGNGLNIGPRFLYNGGSQLDPDNVSIDTSLMTLGVAADVYSDTGIGGKPADKGIPFTNTIASNYVGLKFSIRNQYGKLENVQQIIATPCEQKIDFDNLSSTNFGASTPDCIVPLIHNKIAKTPVFFGGDTYINRFTEKNIMPFFRQWLYDQPESTPFNYYIEPNVPYPRYWANSEPWDFAGLYNISNIIDVIADTSFGSGLLPSSYYNLDKFGVNFLRAKNDYFYLANCGIRDFFVESEVLVDFRARGTFDYEEFYSKYRFTDLEFLFNMDPDILTRGNKYIYDYSLSSSRFIFNQYYTQGLLQSKTYDPEVADLCFTSYPNRINYSLPQVQEDTTDGWLTYLPLNRVSFRNDVNSVKNYGKTGIFITFEDAPPMLYEGVDQRETYVGVKTTVGDGGLFAATPVNVTAADKKYEYGSSQDRLGIISTPVGLYYVSQQQGKIFSYGQGLTEISQINMKWWFNEFLPYKLLEDFPDFPHVDNPVAGIGCSAGYNNTDNIIYFSKKDYYLKDEYKGQIEYIEGDNFAYTRDTNKITIKLGDPIFFEDASWTLSFDPKNNQWISFHDWHPNLLISSRNKHYTTKEGAIWEHNAGCNNYCNFYDKQFPFEVGIPFTTGQNVVTVRSIEYFLECYKRDSNFCVDQYHVLDYNFDQAVIFNSEQVSGYLNLNIFPKNNVALSQDYPKVNLGNVDILVSKEEQKYRFNQFWDITDDRGEFPVGSGYPPTGPLIPGTTRLLGNYEENQIWNTQANGYIQELNPVNLNYNKSEVQRKKFRHYNNFVKLIKDNPQDVNMILKFVNMKSLNSPR